MKARAGPDRDAASADVCGNSGGAQNAAERFPSDGLALRGIPRGGREGDRRRAGCATCKQSISQRGRVLASGHRAFRAVTSYGW